MKRIASIFDIPAGRKGAVMNRQKFVAAPFLSLATQHLILQWEIFLNFLPHKSPVGGCDFCFLPNVGGILYYFSRKITNFPEKLKLEEKSRII